MAGPKLTKEKRADLRKEIGEQVAANTKLAVIVKGLASKYGIGENAIRWHHQRIVRGVGPAKVRRAKRGRPKGIAKRRLIRKTRRKGFGGRPSSMRTLAAALGRISPEELRRAIKASRLQAKHDALIVQAARLRGQLNVTERRARALERRLGRVFGV